MACIDIFAPGRLLTLPLLVEQVWLRCGDTGIEATEVYDFVVQVDDGEPLDSFHILSPHFCRRDARGRWEDTAHLSRVRGPSSGWGWFYLNDPEPDVHGCLEMHVAEAVDVRRKDHVPIRALDVPDASLLWPSSLGDDTHCQAFAEIKKSLYSVVLKRPLRPEARSPHDRLWFRLVVEPSTLDIPPVCREPQDLLLDWFFPRFGVSPFVTCPTQVRENTRARINKLKAKAENEHRYAADDIDRVLVLRGFAERGTSTRIGDHRILLSAQAPLRLMLHGNPPTVRYYGTQTERLRLPRGPRRCPRRTPAGTGEDGTATIHTWVGGAAQNSSRDLITLAESILHEAGLQPKKRIEDLATRLTPLCYREGCALINKMVSLGLLSFDSDGCCIPATPSDIPTWRKLAMLRTAYTDPGQFADFPRARTAFGDDHPFRIDFTVNWIRSKALSRCLFLAITLITVIGGLLGIVAFCMSGLREGG